MTPHPSQWGHRRRKKHHPVPSLPPPIRNVKKVALGKPQWGGGRAPRQSWWGWGCRPGGVGAWAKVTRQAGL